MTVKYLYKAVSRHNKLIDECTEYSCFSYAAFNCAFCRIMTKKRKATAKVYRLFAKLQANKILRGKQWQEKIR